MAQSRCAHCLVLLPLRERGMGQILCAPCEAEWQRDFAQRWVYGKPDNGVTERRQYSAAIAA